MCRDAARASSGLPPVGDDRSGLPCIVSYDFRYDFRPEVMEAGVGVMFHEITSHDGAVPAFLEKRGATPASWRSSYRTQHAA